VRTATPLRDLSEKELTAQAIGTKTNPGAARMLDWLCYHTLRSKGSEPGFPDWTLVRDRVVFIELKTETGTLSAAQHHWLSALAAAGQEVFLIRPRHLQMLADALAIRTRIPNGSWPAMGLQKELRKELDHARDLNHHA
jgi:VRR-NUC domain